MKEGKIKCNLCGQCTACEIRRTKPIGKGEKMVIIENVPMISCRNCGHDYFSIEVARVLDNIRTNPHGQIVRKCYAVFEFA